MFQLIFNIKININIYYQRVAQVGPLGPRSQTWASLEPTQTNHHNDLSYKYPIIPTKLSFSLLWLTLSEIGITVPPIPLIYFVPYPLSRVF